MHRIARIVLVAAALAGCEDRPDLPEDHARRQSKLSEVLIARARRASRDPKLQADAGLALAEVVVPSLSPQLRLLAASDDAQISGGAARALVRILLVREADDHAALVTCITTESNAVVAEECLRRVGSLADADRLGLEARLSDAAKARVQDAIAVRRSEVPPQAPTRDELEADDPEARRDAWRRAIRLDDARLATVKGLDAALTHRLADEDESVRLLVSALWLRRSIHVAPPPIDPAAPVEKPPTAGF